MLLPDRGTVALNPNARCIAHLEGRRPGADAGPAPGAHPAPPARSGAGRPPGATLWPTAQVLPLDAWLAAAMAAGAAERPDLPVVLPAVALRWLWWRQAARDAPGLAGSGRDLAPGHARAGCGCAPTAATSRPRALAADARPAGVSRLGAGRRSASCTSAAPAMPATLRGCSSQTTALPGERAADPAGGISPADAGAGRACSPRSRRGPHVERFEPRQRRRSCFRHRGADPESERDAMLAWLRERVAAAPGGIHALIVPDLDANRGALERALAASLQPELELPGSGRDERVFDLAGGHAARSRNRSWMRRSRRSPVPRVRATGRRQAACCAASTWRAPAWSASARIAADLALRDSAGPVRLRGRAARRAAPRARAPRSLRRRSTAAVAALDGPAAARCRRLGRGFRRLPRGLGLAGRRRNRSAAASSRRRGGSGELLRELAALGGGRAELDGIRGARRIAGASPPRRSSRRAANRRSSCWTRYEDPGVQFDSLWVAGLTATAWPRPVAVDPLLPIEVQRQLGMPGVDARGLRGRSAKHHRALAVRRPARSCCPGRNSRTTRSRMASPLLPAELRRCSRRPRRAEPRAPGVRSARLEAGAGGGAAAAGDGSGAGRGAGARTAGASARSARSRNCASARRRSRSRRRASTGACGASCCIVRCSDSGPGSARSRRLLRSTQPARSAAGGSAVDAALAAVAPAGGGPRTVELEREWQRRAIARLLALDLARPPFTVVETERALDARDRRPRAALRVDRVDRVGDELVVIDYKTGKYAELGLARRAHGCAAAAAVRGPASGPADGHRVRAASARRARSTSASAGRRRDRRHEAGGEIRADRRQAERFRLAGDHGALARLARAAGGRLRGGPAPKSTRSSPPTPAGIATSAALCRVEAGRAGRRRRGGRR